MSDFVHQNRNIQGILRISYEDSRDLKLKGKVFRQQYFYCSKNNNTNNVFTSSINTSSKIVIKLVC